MSKDLNQCNFIGRLGKDVDVRYTPAGAAIANLSIACGDDYKDKQTGQKVEQTNWINIVAFGRTAEVMGEYLRKGSKIFVSGKQRTRKWQNKQGVDQHTTEIVANEMQMLDSRDDSNGAGGAQQRAPQQAAQQRPQQAPPADDFDQDIPF